MCVAVSIYRIHLVTAGIYYKTFMVSLECTAEEMMEQALEKTNMSGSTFHYCIWQVASSNREGRNNYYTLGHWE